VTGASDRVADTCNRWACSDNTMDNRTRDLDAEVLRRQCLALDGMHAVKFGCGTGQDTAWLAGRARRVTAMGLSAGMLTRARARLPVPHVRLLRQDIRQT
jgi:trans-aconitate methyltransferase